MRRGERRARASDGFEPIVPLGTGLVERRLRFAQQDDIRALGLALSGYDGLASIHGDGKNTVVVIATESMATDLDDVLAELAAKGGFERIG